jgi:hypothetical protein
LNNRTRRVKEIEDISHDEWELTFRVNIQPYRSTAIILTGFTHDHWPRSQFVQWNFAIAGIRTIDVQDRHEQVRFACTACGAETIQSYAWAGFLNMSVYDEYQIVINEAQRSCAPDESLGQRPRLSTEGCALSHSTPD